MPTHPLVGARDVLRAISKLQRQRLVRAMADLERLEPDLTEYLLDETTGIFGSLIRTGAASRDVHQIHHRLQSLCVVLILSLLSATSDSKSLGTPKAAGNVAAHGRRAVKRNRKEKR